MPRVRICERGGDGVEVFGHPVGEHGGDQIAARREPPVQRRVAGPGPLGDLIQWHVEPLLGEHCPGGLDDRRAIAGGIGSKVHDQPNINLSGEYSPLPLA